MSIVAAIVSLMGAIISGVLATIITLTINHKSEIMREKKQLVADIFGYRFLLNKDSGVEKFYAAMNRVPKVFKDNKNVIESYDYLHRCSLINDAKERSRKMEDALVTFMKELCKAINIDCENWNYSKILNIFGA